MYSPENVIIGQTYDVPCQLSGDEWIPIIFPAHKDGPEFCFNQTPEHYHIDRRFTNNHLEYSAWRKIPNERIEYKQLICLNHTATSFTNILWPFSVVKMHEAYENRTLKRNVCPHQGIRITNSCGTCPGHGLIWNLQTKKLKYKAPFYLIVPGTDYKGVISNGRCDILVTREEYIQAGLVLLLVDSNDRIYPNCGYPMPYGMNFPSGGGTLNITDRNCGDDKEAV